MTDFLFLGEKKYPFKGQTFHILHWIYKILLTHIGQSPVHPPSPLAMRDSSPGSTRPKLPRHRPLNRTQSAPLPQSTLAQLVIQQQHQNFLEKQKQYQQQVHINKVQQKKCQRTTPSDSAILGK